MSTTTTHPDGATPLHDAPGRADAARADAAASGPVDYKRLYDDYWSRPDRWGSHSFADPEPIVSQVLSSCGGGRILDVGCGMGLLVRTLLRRGIDAHGVDIAAAPVARANELAPGRFGNGSILAIPFPDASFDTVISTDVLEHVAEADVPRALAELFRVCRRAAFVRLAVTPDRDRKWHLTVRDRAWWEGQFFEAGFSRHLLSQKVVSFEQLDEEGWQITLVMQKLPRPEGFAGDLLTRIGREAEAELARATRAAWFVRPGDVVVVAGAGAGASAAVLASQTSAHRVLGICETAEEAQLASARFGPLGLPLEFRPRSREAFLAGLPARSAGLVYAIGEHAAASATDVLVPGGRLIVGGAGKVPADAGAGAVRADESGRSRADGTLYLERTFAQQFGADAAEGQPEVARAMKVLETGVEPPESDHWMRVLTTEVVGAAKQGYVERSFPDHSDEPEFHVGNYARDHDNPWLLRAMISMGMRSPNRGLVSRMAGGVLEGARAGSADQGAALCVLAYRLLEQDEIDPKAANDLLQRLEAFVADAEATPHAQRWRISNQYAIGQLRLARGEVALARKAFATCAGMDVMVFSPLLASKTIDACFQSGLMHANAGEKPQAREWWQKGLAELHRVLHEDWLNVWGKPERPMPFGLPDVGLMVDAASRCAFGLLWLDDWERRPGMAWSWTMQRTLSDHRRWIARLEDTRDWLDRERGRFRTLSQERQRIIERLQHWNDKLRASRAWLIGQRDGLRTTLSQREQRISALGEQLEVLRGQLARANERAETAAQARRGLAEKLEERRRVWQESSEGLEQARQWLATQLKAQQEARAKVEKANADLRGTVTNLQQHISDLSKARAWLTEQLRLRDAAVDAAKAGVAARDARLQELRTRIETLDRARVWLEAQVKRSRETTDRQKEQLATARQQIRKLDEARQWLEGQLAQSRQTIQERDPQFAALCREQEVLKAENAILRARTQELEQTVRHLRRDGQALRLWAGEMLEAKENLAQALETARERAAERQAIIASLRRSLARIEEVRGRQRAQADPPAETPSKQEKEGRRSRRR